MMAENLDKLLEHKARLLQDKAKLENDPPYMEMQVRFYFKTNTLTQHSSFNFASVVQVKDLTDLSVQLSNHIVICCLIHIRLYLQTSHRGGTIQYTYSSIVYS